MQHIVNEMINNNKTEFNNMISNDYIERFTKEVIDKKFVTFSTENYDYENILIDWGEDGFFVVSNVPKAYNELYTAIEMYEDLKDYNPSCRITYEKKALLATEVNAIIYVKFRSSIFDLTMVCLLFVYSLAKMTDGLISNGGRDYSQNIFLEKIKVLLKDEVKNNVWE